MKKFSVLNIVMVFGFVNCLNTFFLKTVKPNRLRAFLNIKTNENYNYINYSNVKKIMKDNMPLIDIYGDKMENMNAEHIFPQFSFKNDPRRHMMKADMHNLYLCNSKINNMRQNFKYINPDTLIYDNDKILDNKGNPVEKNNLKKELFQKNGYLMITNYKNKTFIPAEYSRGKIARSLAYFGVKYNYINELSNIIDYKTLIEWNINDPVDNEEYLKNVICYRHQKNLNPFIIDPEMMLYAFSDLTNIDKDMIDKFKTTKIDPLYCVDFLLKDIDQLEKDNKKYEQFVKKHLDVKKKNNRNDLL